MDRVAASAPSTSKGGNASLQIQQQQSSQRNDCEQRQLLATDAAASTSKSYDAVDIPTHEVPSISLEDAIEEIGTGVFQFRLMIVLGVLLGSEAIAMFLLTFIRDAVQDDFGVSSDDLSYVASGVFCGILCGSFVSGILADHVGRWLTGIIFASIFCVACLAIALSQSIAVFGVMFCCLGFGTGGGHVTTSMMMEFVPREAREIYMAALYSAWTWGALVQCLGAYLLRDASWRYLVLVTMAPMMLAVAGFYWVPESPRFYVVKNRLKAATAVLRQAARANGAQLDEFRLEPVAHTSRGSGGLSKLHTLRSILSGSMLRLTLTLWLLWGVANATYYGIVMLSTSTLMGNGKSADSYLGIAVASLGELPVYPAMYVLSKRAGRKLPLIVLPLVSAAFLLGMKLAADGASGDGGFPKPLYLLELFCAFSTRGICLLFFDLVYLFTPEAYPTAVRTTGTGTCSAMARTTGIATPYIVYQLGGGFAPFGVFAAVLVVGSVISVALPFDTKGVALSDHVGDVPRAAAATAHADDDDAMARQGKAK